jgi:hypothetical protein
MHPCVHHQTIGTVVRDSPELRSFWGAKLPSPATLQALAKHHPTPPDLKPLDGGEEPYGQLTMRGADELRSLGQHLRKRYAGFLPSELDPTVVAARVSARLDGIFLGAGLMGGGDGGWPGHQHPEDTAVRGLHAAGHVPQGLPADRGVPRAAA